MAINTFVTSNFDPANPGPIGNSAPSTGEFTYVTVNNNLEVIGSITTTNTETLAVQNPIIYVADGATSINSLDQGIVGHFVSGTYQHTGLVRDHSDGKWKLFKGVTTEPTTVINWSQAVYDTLYLGTVEAVNGMTIGGNTVATQNWVSSQGFLTSAAIGATVQAYSANLTSWAGVATTDKQDTLVSGTNIKTINGTSVLGSGNISITGGSGTVTDVAALTLGTTGTDLSSTVANGTTTPVITLNVPTASATNRGALSSTDWSTFNGKQAALVSGTNIKTVNSTSLLGSGDVAVQDTLVSGTNIKTINGNSVLGSGDLTVSGTVTGFWAATVDKLTGTQQSTSTALANVTQLVEPMVANGVYKVDCFVTFQSAATTTGLNLGFTSPSGSICQLEVVVPITSTAASTQLRTTFPNAATATNTGNVLGTGVTAINSNHTARISGTVTCGATAGDFQVRFATEVNASAVTLQIGSSLVMQRIA